LSCPRRAPTAPPRARDDGALASTADMTPRSHLRRAVASRDAALAASSFDHGWPRGRHSTAEPPRCPATPAPATADLKPVASTSALRSRDHRARRRAPTRPRPRHGHRVKLLSLSSPSQTPVSSPRPKFSPSCVHHAEIGLRAVFYTLQGGCALGAPLPHGWTTLLPSANPWTRCSKPQPLPTSRSKPQLVSGRS
jgi:hypothetical protein